MLILSSVTKDWFNNSIRNVCSQNRPYHENYMSAALFRCWFGWLLVGLVSFLLCFISLWNNKDLKTCPGTKRKQIAEPATERKAYQVLALLFSLYHPTVLVLILCGPLALIYRVQLFIKNSRRLIWSLSNTFS